MPWAQVSGISPKGVNSALRAFIFDRDCGMQTINGANASLLGEVGGVGFRLQAKVNALWGLQPASGAPLRMCFPKELSAALLS